MGYRFRHSRRFWYRPPRKVSSTSDDFDAARPATYGRLYLIDAETVPFERENLNVRVLLERMAAAGMLLTGM